MDMLTVSMHIMIRLGYVLGLEWDVYLGYLAIYILRGLETVYSICI